MSETETIVSQLLRLWVRHQADVHRYVFSLLPNEADAQEVLQATCVALWRKVESIDFDRPFLPLAFRFAQLEVRKYREKNVRWASFASDDLIETMATERVSDDDLLRRRREALDGCLTKLASADRDLPDRYYAQWVAVPALATITGRSVHMVYKNLQRIRRQLLACVVGQLGSDL